MDAEMMKDGAQTNLTGLWHSEVVRDAAKDCLEAADALERLSAPPAVPATPVAWQPISTAPRDQRSIQGLNENSAIQKVCWRSEMGSDNYQWGAGKKTWKPTHWQPLPYFHRVPLTEPPLVTSSTLYAAPVPAHSDVRGSERDSIQEA